MAAERKKLTEDLIQKLKARKGDGRRYVYDTLSRHLAVCVTEKEARIYYWVRKVNRKVRRIRFGSVDEITLKLAREKADKATSLANEGHDPKFIKDANQRSADTLAAVFPRFLDHKRTKGRKGRKLSEKTLYDYDKQFKLHLKPWANRPLDSIEKRDVTALHLKIGKSKSSRAIKNKEKCRESTANRVLALIGSIYSYAIDFENYAGQNPASRVEKFEEVSRDRFLTFDEIKRFIEALKQEPNTTCRDYFMMSILVGQRRENIMSMRWDAIDFERGVWSIPRIKGGKPHIVPLPVRAIRLLEMRKVDSDSEWVFPSQGKGSRVSKLGYLREPRIAWKRVLMAANLEDVTLHDLRRTLASWQTITGASLAVTGKLLGHTSSQATQVYARLNTDPVLAAMETAHNTMFAEIEL